MIIKTIEYKNKTNEQSLITFRTMFCVSMTFRGDKCMSYAEPSTRLMSLGCGLTQSDKWQGRINGLGFRRQQLARIEKWHAVSSIYLVFVHSTFILVYAHYVFRTKCSTTQIKSSSNNSFPNCLIIMYISISWNIYDIFLVKYFSTGLSSSKLQ